MSKYGTDFVKALKPAKYNYKEEMADKIPNYGDYHFGIMAQSIDNYLSSISDDTHSIIQFDENEKMMVDYMQLIAPLVKTVQELEARISDLESTEE